MVKFWYNYRDLLHTLLAFIFFLISSYLVYLSIAFIDDNNLYKDSKVLNDVLISLTEPLQKILPLKIADYIMFVLIGMTFARVLWFKEKSTLIFRRILYVCGSMYLLRIIFILVTQLPPPFVGCNTRAKDIGIFKYSLLLITQMDFTCGDVFFSGHTIFFMTFMMLYIDYPLFLKKKQPVYYYLLKTITLIMAFIALLSLIVSTYHYTIDVITAAIFYFVIWRFYHLIINHDILDKYWYARLIHWIDGRHLIPSTTPMKVDKTAIDF